MWQKVGEMDVTDRLPNCIKRIKVYLKLYDDDWCAWNLLGCLYEIQADYDESKGCFKTALDFNVNRNEDKIAISRNLARICLKLNDLEGASEILSSYSEINWTDRVLKALLLFKLGNVVESLEIFDNILEELNGESFRDTVLFTVCRILWSIGTPEHIELARSQALQR